MKIIEILEQMDDSLLTMIARVSRLLLFVLAGIIAWPAWADDGLSKLFWRSPCNAQISGKNCIKSMSFDLNLILRKLKSIDEEKYQRVWLKEQSSWENSLSQCDSFDCTLQKYQEQLLHMFGAYDEYFALEPNQSAQGVDQFNLPCDAQLLDKRLESPRLRRTSPDSSTAVLKLPLGATVRLLDSPIQWGKLALILECRKPKVDFKIFAHIGSGSKAYDQIDLLVPHDGSLRKRPLWQAEGSNNQRQPLPIGRIPSQDIPGNFASPPEFPFENRMELAPVIKKCKRLNNYIARIECANKAAQEFYLRRNAGLVRKPTLLSLVIRGYQRGQWRFKGRFTPANNSDGEMVRPEYMGRVLGGWAHLVYIFDAHDEGSYLLVTAKDARPIYISDLLKGDATVSTNFQWDADGYVSAHGKILSIRPFIKNNTRQELVCWNTSKWPMKAAILGWVNNDTAVGEILPIKLDPTTPAAEVVPDALAPYQGGRFMARRNSENTWNVQLEEGGNFPAMACFSENRR